MNHSTKPKPDVEKRGTPLQPVDLISASDNSPPESSIGAAYWTANWRKPQQRKHQTWDDDAYISLTNGKLVMISEEGKVMGSAPWKGDPLVSGYCTFIGGKEVELDSPVKASQLPTLIGSFDDKLDTGTPLKTQLDPSDTFAPPPSVSKFVAPTAFYGTPIKRNPKGPL
ncbi:hypothetical protein DXG03_003877 [Asterophora parasitica]|uniref:Uncharacterized protein n=1 Tax=Asterophora parasitica TaxID=117018 RepID=A0A9P7GAJ9_9AGAR|nr:hypothetical protein DXG03_003877 [Asterophora parasitica]